MRLKSTLPSPTSVMFYEVSKVVVVVVVVVGAAAAAAAAAAAVEVIVDGAAGETVCSWS